MKWKELRDGSFYQYEHAVLIRKHATRWDVLWLDERRPVDSYGIAKTAKSEVERILSQKAGGLI